MTLHFVVSDVLDDSEPLLKRGELIDTVGYGQLVGFPGLEGRYAAMIDGDHQVVPGESLELMNWKAQHEVKKKPHYILERRGMNLDGPMVRLLQLQNPPILREVPLAELLAGLNMTHDDFRAEVHRLENPTDGGLVYDLMFYEDDGVWKQQER